EARRPPVIVEATRRSSGRSETAAKYSSSAAAAGATSREWKACETGSRVPPSPAASARRRTEPTPAAGPDTTVCRGPLRPATTTSSSARRNGSTRSRGAALLAIAPPPSASSAIARPRLLELGRRRGQDRGSSVRAQGKAPGELRRQVAELRAAGSTGEPFEPGEARVERVRVRRPDEEELRILGGGAEPSHALRQGG